MATEAPDPRDFTSWEDAFQYPVPVVRKLEQQLRVNLNENREKLRSLVGASYRDLLGTADRIIAMDDEMQRMETVLNDVGRKCNSRFIERIVASHAKMTRVRQDAAADRRGLASTLALLQACMRAAARMVKKSEKPLLAAKLIVLSRLLFNSASRSPDAPPVLESLRTKLGALRRKLLVSIDRQLTKTEIARHELLDALIAFSLATSSAPTDVLRHFLHARQQGLNTWVSNAKDTNMNVAVDMIFTAIDHAQAVFPKRMSDALVRLKSFPLLHDPDIRSIPELDLDIYERWIAEDVRTFTPWPRHDELQIAQAKQMLEPWAHTASKTVLDGLSTLLESTADPQSLVDSRESGLRHLLATKKRNGPLETSSFVQDLRDRFSSRFVALIKTKATSLSEIVNNILDSPTSMTDHQLEGLWDPSLSNIELQNGAVAFRNQVLVKSLGRDSTLQNLTKSLDGWAEEMNEVRKAIKMIKDTRWDDEMDMDDEDDLDSGTYQDMLSKEDSHALSRELESETQRAFSQILDQLGKSTAGSQKGSGSGVRAIFLLRVTREVMHRQAGANDDYASVLDSLHSTLAEHVIKLTLAYRKGGELPFDRLPAVALWEGTPLLPVQPSPVSMRLLQELRKAMQSTGTDLWNKHAVDHVKTQIAAVVRQSLETTLLNASEIENPVKVDEPKTNGKAGTDHDQPAQEDADTAAAETNGKADAVDDQPTQKEDDSPADEEKPDSSVQSQQKVIQALYDTIYLERLLAPTSKQQEEPSQLQETAQELQTKASLDDSSMDRIRKSTVDYHKRTYLLHGILCPSY